ncbi:hypothetical protein FQR65_LT20115 [Abscondita terminalis]|nr:hypothetical protein FQR65_LT20115 [Abscondita terminalis]
MAGGKAIRAARSLIRRYSGDVLGVKAKKSPHHSSMAPACFAPEPGASGLALCTLGCRAGTTASNRHRPPRIWESQQLGLTSPDANLHDSRVSPAALFAPCVTGSGQAVFSGRVQVRERLNSQALPPADAHRAFDRRGVLGTVSLRCIPQGGYSAGAISHLPSQPGPRGYRHGSARPWRPARAGDTADWLLAAFP